MAITNWHAQRIEKLRQKNEGETPMSEESARAFRKEQNERIKTVEHDLDESVERVRVLKGEALLSENKIIELIQEKNTAAATALEERGMLVAELDVLQSKLHTMDAEKIVSESRFEKLVQEHNELNDSKAALKDDFNLIQMSSANEVKKLKLEISRLSHDLGNALRRLKEVEGENFEIKAAAKEVGFKSLKSRIVPEGSSNFTVPHGYSVFKNISDRKSAKSSVLDKFLMGSLGDRADIHTGNALLKNFKNFKKP